MLEGCQVEMVLCSDASLKSFDVLLYCSSTSMHAIWTLSNLLLKKYTSIATAIKGHKPSRLSIPYARLRAYSTLVSLTIRAV